MAKAKRGSKRNGYQTLPTYEKKFKKGKKADNKVTIAYSPSIVPDIMRCCLPYVYLGNAAGTGIVTQVFRGNSIFDPDFTGVGAQPLGHDQWAAFYRRYRVLASKITVHWSSQDLNDSSIGFVTPKNVSAATTNRVEVLEAQGAKSDILSIQSGQGRAITVEYMDTAKQRGATKQAIRNDNDYSAAFGSNPNLQWFWHVGVMDTNNVLDTISVDLMVKIEYYVEFFDRETLTQS